ncbi:MAG: transglycosylase domain-containing protein [Chloroflexota bacterium]
MGATMDGGGPQPPREPIPRRASASRGFDLGHFIRTRGGFIALGLIVVLSGVFTYVLWTLRDLPDPGQQDVLAGSVTVYDRNGQVVEQRNGQGQFHDVLQLKDMGKFGPAATLAAEDRDFYHHGAIDIGATARAAWVDVTHGGYEQGGSTITQQLIKIQLLTPQKSVFRKVQEAILATALEQRYSKDQILEMYLNRVYYGHNAYGLGAATKTYFGADKKPKDLTAGEAAFLAGLINAPNYYDPQVHYDRAKAREAYVLKGMVIRHDMTQAEADQAANENLQPKLKFDSTPRQSKAPHFVDYVLSKLEQQYGSAAVQQGGFGVYTTLDLRLQALADQAVKKGVADLKTGGVNNGMLLAARPDTGEILAWVGSADYYDDAIGGQFDVITSPRQPGSSFKPYDFEAALKDHKITLATVVHDKQTDFGGGYKPVDFDNRFMGDMSARKALLLSRNVPAVEVAKNEGIDNVINLAHAMGIRTDLQPVLSTAIGGSEVTMFDHLQGYSVFANQGKKMPLMAIKKIADAHGNTLFEQQPGKQDGQQAVLTPAEAYLITDVLKDYAKQWNLGWNKPFASKSGTTGGSQTGVHKDAWMMAYDAKIAVGAWGGNTLKDGGGKSISTFGTEVGQTVLASFINGLPAEYAGMPPRPDGMVDGKGCPGMDNASKEIFIAGTEKGSGCTPASPSPSPSPSDTPTPTAAPVTPVPTAGPTATPTPTPKPSATPSP